MTICALQVRTCLAYFGPFRYSPFTNNCIFAHLSSSMEGEYARGLDEPRFSSDNDLSDADQSDDDLSHGDLNDDDLSDEDSLPPGFQKQGPSIAIRFA